MSKSLEIPVVAIKFQAKLQGKASRVHVSHIRPVCYNQLFLTNIVKAIVYLTNLGQSVIFVRSASWWIKRVTILRVLIAEDRLTLN